MSGLLCDSQQYELCALEGFFAESMSETQQLLETFKFLAQEALHYKEILTKPLERLVQSQSKTIQLSQRQCFCLLCLAFFDILPAFPFLERPYKFTMRYWLGSEKEKLKCIFCYFRSMSDQAKAHPENWGSRKILFIRKVAPFNKESLKAQICSSQKCLVNASICSTGTIEDCAGKLQADFANKKIGGGVLTRGSVQE